MDFLLNAKLKKCINGIKHGDENSFDNLYESTKGAVFKMAYSVLRNRLDSEDVMQETYVSILKHIDNISAEKNVFAYILTTTKNKALNLIYSRKKVEGLDSASEVAVPEPECSDGPMWARAKKELCKEDYTILEMCVAGGFRRSEVAKILGQPVSTVNWKYNNILKKLGAFYSEEYYE